MKKIINILFVLVLTFVSSSCIHTVSVGPEEEAVLVDKPWFFGHGGVRQKPVDTGLKWVWWSTHSNYFSIIPTRYDETFDDIFSNDNTPLDFNSYITIQIRKGKTPILIQNYGTEWYKNNIQVPYRNYTREEVSKYSPFDLISNREILNQIDSSVMAKMNRYLNRLSVENGEFPIVICGICTGAASPNKEQMDEMNATARTIQAKQTQNREEEMQNAREAAEKARARADKAYQNAMGLSADQFIQLKYIEMISNKPDANIDVLVGGANNMWNIRR